MSTCGRLHCVSFTMLAIFLLVNHATAASIAAAITAEKIATAAAVGSCIGDIASMSSPDCNTFCKFQLHNFFNARHKYAVHLTDPVRYYHNGQSSDHVPDVFVPEVWQGWTTEKIHHCWVGTEGVMKWTIRRVRNGQGLGYLYMLWSVPYSGKNRCSIGTSSQSMEPGKWLRNMMYAEPQDVGCGYEHCPGSRARGTHHFHDFAFRWADSPTSAEVDGFGIRFKMNIGMGSKPTAKILMMPNVDGIRNRFSTAQIQRLQELSSGNSDDSDQE